MHQSARVGRYRLPGGAVAPHAAAPADGAAPCWPKARISTAESLWGRGFTLPGGASETIRLVKPLGLSPHATLLLLGGGLGGPAECISNAFGAWVTSFESDAMLRERAAKRIADQKIDHVSVSSWTPLEPNLPRSIANHALSLQAMRGSKPLPFLESLAGSLRPNGQIVLTELVSDATPDERDREFAAWCKLDNRLPNLPSAQMVTEGLQRLNFDVRVVEDMSSRHTVQMLGGWREAVREMAAGPRPAAQTAAAFVNEAEIWLLRFRLMRRLGVRLLRWHAIAV